MRKMRLIGIIGAVIVLIAAIVIKLSKGSPAFAIPLLLPFLVMILIDLSGRSDKAK